MASDAKNSDDLRRFGWPPFMSRRRAALYCGVHETSIDKARRAGELTAAGRRGGYGEWVYSRVALDRWMTGIEAGTSTEPERRRRSSNDDWNAELEQLVEGGR